jgi:hypothetical protein
VDGHGDSEQFSLADIRQDSQRIWWRWWVSSCNCVPSGLDILSYISVIRCMETSVLYENNETANEPYLLLSNLIKS